MERDGKWSKLRASEWLCFNSVLFSLALMGICCKNSSWCNGTAYAKISHKPLQLLSEVFHLVWACLRQFALLLCIPCALHMTTANLSFTLFCHPAQVPLLQAWTVPAVYFWMGFNENKNSYSLRINAIQFYCFSLCVFLCYNWTRSHTQHLPLILISCLINNSLG